MPRAFTVQEPLRLTLASQQHLAALNRGVTAKRCRYRPRRLLPSSRLNVPSTGGAGARFHRGDNLWLDLAQIRWAGLRRLALERRALVREGLHGLLVGVIRREPDRPPVGLVPLLQRQAVG